MPENETKELVSLCRPPRMPGRRSFNYKYYKRLCINASTMLSLALANGYYSPSLVRPSSILLLKAENQQQKYESGT